MNVQRSRFREGFERWWQHARANGIDGPIAMFMLMCGVGILLSAASWIYFLKLSLPYAILLGLIAAAGAWMLFVPGWRRLLAWYKWLDEQKKKWQDPSRR